MEEFVCGTRITAGPGAISALSRLGAEKVMLVTDPFFVRSGAAGKVLQASGAAETRIFDRVQPEPSAELAAEGTLELEQFGADGVIALGGGSAMDLAKAMIYFSKRDIPLAAVPTTSGSGSEVTDFAVLSHEGVKHPLVDQSLRPCLAVLDGDLLETMPPSLAADSGFDAVSHAVEAYAATGAGAISDALAKEAFCILFAGLPASFAGAGQVRLRIHRAATMAGLAFSQAGLGLCHAMAHSLGGKFHVPHGRLNAILLPWVIDVNARAAGSKYAGLARAAGLGGSVDTLAVRNLRNGLCRLRRDLKLPETLAQAGVEPGKVRACREELVAAALADPCCRTNPVRPEDFLVRRILEEVTGRE